MLNGEYVVAIEYVDGEVERHTFPGSPDGRMLDHIELAKSAALSADRRGVEVTCVTVDGPVMVRCSEKRRSAVFTNLVGAV